MKEATGELNMTVVTVVAIAAVGAFFYAFVWPSIQAGLAKNTCGNAGGTWSQADKCCTYEDGSSECLD